MVFASGELGEIAYFLINIESKLVVAVYHELVPDIRQPFFFDKAGHHTIRMTTNKLVIGLEHSQILVEGGLMQTYFLLKNFRRPYVGILIFKGTNLQEISNSRHPDSPSAVLCV